MNNLLIAIVLFILSLVLLETGLRIFFGFGNPLLYIADSEIGYLLAPNQTVRRFGNRIAINQYSMRSAAISIERPSNCFRVLLLGDSVANGGWWTDQSKTISTLLQQQLQQNSNSVAANYQLEVLNASANSWGPRNELAYLKRFGTFSAQVLVLILNTDDLFATAPVSLAVGRDLNYPDRRPKLALQEVISRYILRPKPDPALAKAQAEEGDRVAANLAAIQTMHTLVQQAGGVLVLMMTPLLREVLEPGPRDYEIEARQRLVEFTKTHTLTYLDMLHPFRAVSEPTALFRDHIHLSPAGNQLISETIFETLKSSLQIWLTNKSLS